MFNDPAFSITRIRKPQTKNSKTSNKNTTRLSIFERTSTKKTKKKKPSDFSCFVKVGFFFGEEPL